MPVPRLGAAFRDPVPVEVEQSAFDHEIPQARFLPGLAQGRAGQVAVAVGVPARLQPAIELAVVGEQRAPAIGADQPRGSGEMALQPLAAVGIRARGLRKFGEFRHGGGFVGMAPAVVGECVDECGHAREMPGAGRRPRIIPATRTGTDGACAPSTPRLWSPGSARSGGRT